MRELKDQTQILHSVSIGTACIKVVIITYVLAWTLESYLLNL